MAHKGMENAQIDSEKWKPILNPKKRPARVANGNGECLLLPGPSKVLRADGRFHETIRSLEILSGEQTYEMPQPVYRTHHITVASKEDFDPVMPNVIAEEVIIDVDSVGQSPSPPQNPPPPQRRTIMVQRSVRDTNYHYLKQYNDELKQENDKLRETNNRLRAALDERGLKIKDILAENAKYFAVIKQVEKHFGEDVVKDFMDK